MTETTDAPALPENSDAAVRARFNQSVSELPAEKRGNVQISKEFEKAPEKPEAATEKKVEAKAETKTESAIPEEFLTDKKDVDEWDAILKEEVKSPKSENFKRVKDVAQRKIEALLKKLTETEAKVKGDDYVPEKISKQLETLNKALQERDDLISRKYVEETPQFREKFTLREQLINKQAEKLGKQLGLEDDQIQALLTTTGKRQDDLLSEIESSGGQSKMAALLLEKERLQSEKDDFLQNHEKTLSEWSAQEQARLDGEKARMKEYEDRVFTETLGELSKSFGPLQKIDGNEKWNSQVEADIQEAKRFMEGEFTPKEYAEIALGGVAWKRGARMLESAISELRSARAELAELKAAGPSASQAKTGDADPTAHMSADERAAYTFRQAVGAAQNNGF